MRITSQIASAAVAVATFVAPVESQIASPVNFRVGIQTASTRRNSSLDKAVIDRGNITLQGFDAVLSPPDGGAGIGGRFLQGGSGDQSLTLKEGTIFVGGDLLRVEGAYGQRSLFGTDSALTFTRGGLRSIIQLGGSGVSVNVNGSAYFPGNLASDHLTKLKGWEGETDIFYVVPKVPIFFQLGYRAEYFSLETRAEHLSGVVLGTGLWLGY